MIPTLITRAGANLRPPNKPPQRLFQGHPGVVIHCTAGHRPRDLAEALLRWRNAQHFHQAPPHWIEVADPKTGKPRRKNLGGNGWADIGYHFGVTPSGEVLEGRGWLVRGAHSGKGHGRNRCLGIVVQGDGSTLAEPEQQAIEWLVAEHVQRGGVPLVLPHNAFSTKRCPGPAVTRWVLERWPTPLEAA